MKPKSGNAIFSVILALMLAGLACAGGATPPTTAPATAAPTQAAPTQAAPTQAAPTKAPPTAAPTSAPTEAPKATDTQAAPTSAPAKATATKAPLSGKLEVQTLGTYLDHDSYFHVVGLVTNGTDKPVTNIQLAVQLTDNAGKTVLKDDAGKLTSTVSIDTLLSALGSGETTPFAYDISASGADTSGWQAKVAVASSKATDLQRVTVEIANDQVTVNSDGTVFVTGELVNQSDKPAQISGFASAMLDGPDKVAGAAGYGAIARLLAPAGDTAGLDRTPFVINIPGPIKAGATPSYYVDAIEGNPDDLKTMADLHLKLNTNYVDSGSGVHMVATISNSGTNTVTVRLVAGVYDQAGKVLDASEVDTPFELLPGHSSPAVFYYFGNLNGKADQIAKVVTFTAQIDPYWTFSTSINVVALAASNVTTETSGSSVTIAGNLVNTTKLNVDIPIVVVEAKDANGKIVAVDWTGATGTSPLKPGQKATFSLSIDLPDKTDPATLKYEVASQAQVSQ